MTEQDDEPVLVVQCGRCGLVFNRATKKVLARPGPPKE